MGPKTLLPIAKALKTAFIMMLEVNANWASVVNLYRYNHSRAKQASCLEGFTNKNPL